MVRIFYTDNHVIAKATELGQCSGIPAESILWVDLQNPTEDEISQVETRFHVKFQTQQQSEEIESSSRYFETDEYIVANSNFLRLENGQYLSVPVSLILKDKILFTYRSGDLKSFAETVKKIKANNRLFLEGSQVMVSIFETRVDLDADLIELTTREIGIISKQLTYQSTINEEVLLNITRLQETTILIRENIIDKQRLVMSLLRSDVFSPETMEKLRVTLRDINSLLQHTAFSFERLEYLQNTSLGLVNIEQNKIIKIFTVVSVVFMPPTLIASLYGMNFKVLPELSWSFGYPFAILLMVSSSIFTLFFFKKKGWL
jgi:magnesium transporter